ncbi:MAG: hypothetical protein QXR44_03710 [Thermoproteota archaeon]
MSREHTAEHVLMGSLQRIKGSFKVRKVEVYDGSGRVFIEVDSLSFEELAKAQAMANKVISEGRIVKEHFFDSLEEAQKAFPNLRAHEERIQGRVRVVEVDGFDYSACTGKHVENTRDCGMVLVTHVSKGGGEYQIDFEIGEKALETAVKLSSLCLSISSILGTPIKNLEKAVLNMRFESEDLRKKLSVLTEEIVKKTPLEESLGETKLYAAILRGADTKAVMKTIGELIGKNHNIYILGLEWSGTCNMLIGSGDERINATQMLKGLCNIFNGKGGGDNKIAMGSFPCEKFQEVFEEAKRIVRDSLTRGNSK